MTIETSEDLKAFILDPQRMRMSHIYKPLMVIAVLRNGGAASRNEIAAEFIGRDVFQLEHYRRNIVDRMPGTRLVRDGVLERDGDTYRLAGALRGLDRSERPARSASRNQPRRPLPRPEPGAAADGRPL